MFHFDMNVAEGSFCSCVCFCQCAVRSQRTFRRFPTTSAAFWWHGSGLVRCTTPTLRNTLSPTDWPMQKALPPLNTWRMETRMWSEHTIHRHTLEKLTDLCPLKLILFVLHPTGGDTRWPISQLQLRGPGGGALHQRPVRTCERPVQGVYAHRWPR